MSDAVRYRQDLVRYGQTATVAAITGTACPCMVSRDSARPSYSAQWHRDNTGAAACNGTGLISRTTTSTTIYGLFIPLSAAYQVMRAAEKLAEIGELDNNDMMLYGATTSTGTAFDLSALVERKDTITWDGKTFLVRMVFDLGVSIEMGQWAILKRTA